MNKYTAFISYRHQSPDADIAKKLEGCIENFAVPSQLRASLGVKKLGRVFRDQDELPLSSNLGEDIHKALENSDWLICICSPRYLESRWCMEELRYFISLGKQDRILTVLVEGQPEESFPKELCFQEIDGQTVEKEPLAADVRAESTPASLKKLQSEKLRIIAPILGVEYDDLKQRARRRKTRIAAGVAAAAFVVLAGFLGYAINKNAQIRKERNDALTAESKWLSKSADEALGDGEMMLSMLLSLEALPKDSENPERPLVNDALISLQNAIFSGMGDNRYHSVTTIDIPGLSSFRASGNNLISFSPKSEGYITAYDLNTGKPIETDFKLKEAPISCFFNERLSCFAVYPDRVERGGSNISNAIIGKDESGEFVWGEVSDSYSFSSYVDSTDGNGGYMLLKKGSSVSGKGGGVFTGYQIYNAAYREYLQENDGLLNSGGGSNYGFGVNDAKPINIKEGTGGVCYVIGGYNSEVSADNAPAIILADIMNGHDEQDNVLFRYYIDGEKAEKVSSSPISLNKYYRIDSLDVSCDSSIIAGYWSKALYFWNASVSKMVSSFDMSVLAGNNVSIKKAAFSGKDRNIIAILTDDGHIYIYDCVNGEVRMDIQPGLYKTTDFQWNLDSSRLLLTCDDNSARIVSADEGEVLQTLPCSFEMKRAQYGSHGADDNSSNDTFILLSGNDRIQVWQMNSMDPELSLTRRINDQAFGTDNSPLISKTGAAQIALSEDEKTLWTCTKNGLCVYDIQTLERIKTFYNDTSGLRISVLNGRVYVFGVSKDLQGIVRVIDAEKLEEITDLRVNYPHDNIYVRTDGTVSRIDRSKNLQIKSVDLSKDGSLIMINTGSSSSFDMEQPDPAIFVYDAETLEELWHIGYDGGDIQDKIFGFAKDWQADDFFLLKGYFLKDTGKILCQYIYGMYKADGVSMHRAHMAFEIRDARTGAVEKTYSLPWISRVFIYFTKSDIYIQNESNYPAYTQAVPESIIDAERGIIIVQETDNTVHVVGLESGEEIAEVKADTVIKRCWIGEDEIRMWFTMKGNDDQAVFANDAFVVKYDGSVQAVSSELEKPREPDGYYGSSPVYANEDGVYDSASGEMLIKWPGKYNFFRSFDGGNQLLLSSGGDIILMNYTSPGELRELALRILDGRKLTEEQRIKHYLQ